MASDRPRVYARVTDDLFDQITYLSEKFGITKSALVGMCTQMGINYLMTVVEPENVLSNERLAEIVAMAEHKSMELEKNKDK